MAMASFSSILAKSTSESTFMESAREKGRASAQKEKQLMMGNGRMGCLMDTAKL